MYRWFWNRNSSFVNSWTETFKVIMNTFQHHEYVDVNKQGVIHSSLGTHASHSQPIIGSCAATVSTAGPETERAASKHFTSGCYELGYISWKFNLNFGLTSNDVNTTKLATVWVFRLMHPARDGSTLLLPWMGFIYIHWTRGDALICISDAGRMGHYNEIDPRLRIEIAEVGVTHQLRDFGDTLVMLRQCRWRKT